MFEKISFHYLKLLKIWHNSLKYATNQQFNSLFHNTSEFFLWTRICKLKPSGGAGGTRSQLAMPFKANSQHC